MSSSRRALYVSHTGMTEPLGQSQVLPYVRGLARAGWEMDIVGFEPASADADEVEATRRALAAEGIGYHAAPRSPSHGLGTKLFEAGGALYRLLMRALKNRPQIVHARSYLPGAVAQTVAALAPGARFLFDCRGLLADEYLDAGRITRTSFRYRIIKSAERVLFARAHGVVVLTERLRRWLVDEARLVRPETPIEVIPCCVDLDRFRATEPDREGARRLLGAGDRFVLAYSGTLGSWYLEDEMAAFYAELRRRTPSLFAVYTRSPAERLRKALARAGVPEEEIVVLPVAPRDMPRMLAGADAALSFIAPCFSKIASSPTKVAEYLAVGLPVVMSRGIGDSDALLGAVPAMVDAGSARPEDLARAADALLALDRPSLREPARRAAAERFSLDGVGIPRYRRIYDEVAR